MFIKRFNFKNLPIKKVITVCIFCFVFFAATLSAFVSSAEAMPFYDLQPAEICLRAEFFTSYPSSSAERKHNIKTAAASLDKTFVDAGGEFSFNFTVGERTEKRGYKKAKIIVGGRFTDGVGGGVCQVSTTLYNAVLLSGLTVTEYHPHSLPVSYVAPSFDAMVNSGSADLKFRNDTHNPVIVRVSADDSVIRVRIYGEPMNEKYVRQSRITEEIPATACEIIKDEKGEFPDLFEGERKVLSYGRNGYKSEGVLIKTINGKPVSSKLIRTDKYNAVKTVVMEGTRVRERSEDYSPIGDSLPDGNVGIGE